MRAGLARYLAGGLPASGAHRIGPSPDFGPERLAGRARDAELPETDDHIGEPASVAVRTVAAQVTAAGEGQGDLVVAGRWAGHIRARGMRASPP